MEPAQGGPWLIGVSYEIEVYPDAQEQIQALPVGALTALAEVMTMLELTSWNGAPLNRNNPEGIEPRVRQADECRHRWGVALQQRRACEVRQSRDCGGPR